MESEPNPDIKRGRRAWFNFEKRNGNTAQIKAAYPGIEGIFKVGNVDDINAHHHYCWIGDKWISVADMWLTGVPKSHTITEVL